MNSALILSLALAAALPARGQDSSACAAHHAGVDARGDAVMGFDHEKTTHHFALTREGGVIRVSANDAADAASRDAIRGHLSHVARMFAAGDFEAPFLIHGGMPPGVAVMKAERRAIRWSYEETPAGGRITISTASPTARAAIHDFLRFQIADHETGDATEIGDK